MTVVVVTGGWFYGDRDTVARELSQLMPISLLIESGESGAAHLAARWAEEHGIKVDRYAPQWRDGNNVFHPGARSDRNQAMLDHGKPDMVMAFPGGRDTEDVLRRARRAGIPIRHAVQPGMWDDLLG